MTGKPYVMWFHNYLNKVYVWHHVNFHGDHTHMPTINGNNMNLGCYITFGTFDIIEL